MDSWCAGSRCDRLDMSDEETDEKEPSPIPAVNLFPAKDGSSANSLQDFRASSKPLGQHYLDGEGSPNTEEAVAVHQKTVDEAVQQFWRPWEDKQEDEQEDPVRGGDP